MYAVSYPNLALKISLTVAGFAWPRDAFIA
jgi:hypothetical protein